MSTVGVELTPVQSELLARKAQELGIAPADLAKAAVLDLLGEPDEAFEQAARRVLKKNEALYRRLA